MDYEGNYFPEQDKREENENSSKAGKIIKGVFKYTFWGICALVWGLVFYRMFTSGDAKLLEEMYFSDDAVVIAEKLGDNFRVYSVQTTSTMNKGGTIQIYNNYYAADAKEFEIGLKYRMKHFTGEKDTQLPFEVSLYDGNGKEYSVCNTEFTTKFDYGFARIAFSGIELSFEDNHYENFSLEEYKETSAETSRVTPHMNDDGQVLNTKNELFFIVKYDGQEIARLQVYHDFVLLEQEEYEQGR